MYKEDGRHAVAELLVQGLVVEEVHGDKCRRGASQHGQPEKHSLGDAPAVPAGFPFVEAIG